MPSSTSSLVAFMFLCGILLFLLYCCYGYFIFLPSLAKKHYYSPPRPALLSCRINKDGMQLKQAKNIIVLRDLYNRYVTICSFMHVEHIIGYLGIFRCQDRSFLFRTSIIPPCYEVYLSKFLVCSVTH